MKLRTVIGILCERRIPTRLKGSFDRTVNRPCLRNTASSNLGRMNVMDMSMIRWYSLLLLLEQYSWFYIKHLGECICILHKWKDMDNQRRKRRQKITYRSWKGKLVEEFPRGESKLNSGKILMELNLCKTLHY